MSEEKPKFLDRVVQVLAVMAVISLFITDFIFDLSAKPIPWWAYAVPGLLALGVELPSLRRLIMAAVRAAAKIPPEDGDSK